MLITTMPASRSTPGSLNSSTLMNGAVGLFATQEHLPCPQELTQRARCFWRMHQKKRVTGWNAT
jgi:hypothetical protein